MVALSVCLVALCLLAGAGAASGATAVTAKTIVNVGGSGSYDEVVSMPCGPWGGGSCSKVPRSVSGCLAPFDEEQTLKLRGPMEVSDIAVYYPSGGGDWGRVSSYKRGGGSDNMVFLADYGRAADGTSVDEGSCWSAGGDWKFISNGDDFMCNGYNQSYVSADGKCARRVPEAFEGVLEDGVQVNAMQAATCADGRCGFYRGRGHHGWAGSVGGGKMFAVRARFPDGGGNNAPALWFLHASVVRTANYHPQMCNCRGMGGAGGCGELDIAEVVEEQDRKQDVDTTVYSFKGAFSDQGAYTFPRPTSQETVFVTIFNPEGYIQVVQTDGFDFGASVPASRVQEWNARRELVIKLPGEEMAGCGGPQCSYVYEQNGAGFAARVEDGVQCSGGSGEAPGARPNENSRWQAQPGADSQGYDAQGNDQTNSRENGQNSNGQDNGQSNNGQDNGQNNDQAYGRPAAGDPNGALPPPWGQSPAVDGNHAASWPPPAQQPAGNPHPGYDYNGNSVPHDWGAGWGQSSSDGGYGEDQGHGEYHSWGRRRRLFMSGRGR